MRLLLAALAIACAMPALAHDHDAWLSSQVSPKTGGNCCDGRDGDYAEEKIEQGHYWVRCALESHCPIKEWMVVPDDVIIREPNRNGAPAVWWYWENGEPVIRCFAPGGGV